MVFKIGNSSKLRHGHARRGQQAAEHRCWQAVKRRCIDPNHSKFKYYGGRGVTICARWENDFESFLADVGNRPSPKHSLDRYPNRHGNYEPDNVRWATRAQQDANRDCTRTITLDGETMPVADVCRRLGLNLKAVRNRLDIGWTPEAAVSRPIVKRVRRAA